MTASLAGCSLVPGRDTRAGYEAVADASAPATGDGRAPLATLPAAAGAVVAVLQTTAHGVLTQRIVLKGDPDTVGENAIVVKVNVDPGPWDIDGPVGLPTKAMIAGELDAAFAGVDMQLSQTFARNSFGPFGYAIGHPNPRVTCIYAWEFAVWRGEQFGEGPGGAPSLPQRPTSVRVRLCRSSIGEAEILPMLRDLQVFPANSRVAYSDPNYKGGESGGDALTAAGVNYFVVPGAKPSAPAREPRAAAPEHRRRKVAHHARRHERAAEREDRGDRSEGRAVAVDPPARGSIAVPMPGGAAPAPAAAAAPAVNPLLAPLSTISARAAADDMPLPSRAAPGERAIPAAPAPPPTKSASIPLPN